MFTMNLILILISEELLSRRCGILRECPYAFCLLLLFWFTYVPFRVVSCRVPFHAMTNPNWGSGIVEVGIKINLSVIQCFGEKPNANPGFPGILRECPYAFCLLLLFWFTYVPFRVVSCRVPFHAMTNPNWGSGIVEVGIKIKLSVIQCFGEKPNANPGFPHQRDNSFL